MKFPKITKVVALGVTVIALPVFAACGTEVEQKPDKQDGAAQAAAAEVNKAVDEFSDAEPVEEPEPEPTQPEVAQVGDSITIPTEQSEVKLTVTGVTDPIVPQLDEYGFGDEVSNPGNRFFGVTVSVKNIGVGSVDPSMELSWALSLKSGIEAEGAMMMDTQPWTKGEYVDSAIAPGGKLVMNLPYEGPQGAKLGLFQASAYDADFNETFAEWRL